METNNDNSQKVVKPKQKPYSFSFSGAAEVPASVKPPPLVPVVVVPKGPKTTSPIAELFRKGSTSLSFSEKGFLETGKGVFRGGSGGVWLTDDTIVGCQRKAILRYTGIEVSDEEISEGLEGQGKALMFQAGVTNEDSWFKIMEEAWDGPILREEEIPIRWENQEEGWTLTGRPDIVLAKQGLASQQIKPVRGIELKLICSAWVAAKILEGRPKIDNLRQAALYSWRLSEQYGYDVPFELWYTSRTNFAVSGDWMAKLFPQEGAEGSQFCSYKDAKDREGNAVRQLKGTTPFIKGFLLQWTPHDRLQFLAIDVPGAEWTGTIITKKSIEMFYSSMQTSMNTDTLPPRPTGLDFLGAKDFDVCNYCTLNSLCDSFDSRRETLLSNFVAEVKNLNGDSI